MFIDCCRHRRLAITVPEPTMMPTSLPPRPPPPPCHPMCPPPGGRDDHMRVLISVCITVSVFILVISVLGTAICCWFFHHKYRRRDLHAITGKAGVIVLSDNLQCANQEGRLLFNVALVNVRVCMHLANYTVSY